MIVAENRKSKKTYLDGLFAALDLQIVKLEDFGHDEALFEVRVDATGRLRRLRSFLKGRRSSVFFSVFDQPIGTGAYLNGPRLDLVVSGREEVDELQRLVALDDDLVQGAGHLSVRSQRGQSLFEFAFD